MNAITDQEWLNIGFGGIAGFCLVYFIFNSQSFVTSLILGIPCGMGGVALALFLLRKYCPRLYFLETGNMKITKRGAITGFGGLLISAVYVLVSPSTTSRFVIETIDVFIIVRFIQNRLHKSADRDD